ncbi:MAG: hypothetical protein PHU12_01955 [Candidatus Aenigmarchaeota archaeon]|nr:hypothetical protein [Candidatus Aenigmarchaeota archaeon]
MSYEDRDRKLDTSYNPDKKRKPTDAELRFAGYKDDKLGDDF